MKRFNKLLLRLGFSGATLRSYLKYMPAYKQDLNAYKKLATETRAESDWPMDKNWPILEDKHDTSGILNGAYFHQDLLVAKRVYRKNPARHVDIGSRTDGFVAHVAVFRPIEIIDIRPQASNVENISFLQADLMNPLPDHLKDCCDSISSLHAIEHFGLGRYGDPIDPIGYRKALKNITSMLKKGGTFYFSVPLGPQRVQFNAQRIFSLKYLLDLLKTDYQVLDFSYVDDKGALHESVKITTDEVSTNCNCICGCAIFELQKL